MKNLSIKFKVTISYTIALVFVMLITVFGALWAANSYMESEISEELKDEVDDLAEIIINYPFIAKEENISDYYDDGVVLAVYDADGKKISGIMPVDFPKGNEFLDQKLRHIDSREQEWFYFDTQVICEDGEVYWVRGMQPYEIINGTIRHLIEEMFWLIPFWTCIMMLFGYWMIRRSLSPIPGMVKKVYDINQSADLSLRLPKLKTNDEFAELTETFNTMLDNMEKNFLTEKQFTSDAAHELRTPISVIVSNCEYCLSDFELTEELREELEIIHQKALYMSSLVSQLLTIARAENNSYRPEFEEVDLSILIESVLDELREKANAMDIHLEFQNKLENAYMEGDLNLLTQMFMNLADNAINYGKHGGYVKVTLSGEEGKIRLSVKDNGIGIPHGSIDKIWDRFYRVDQSRSTKGFGLGLFMVRWIVELHKGSISVDSILGEGTEFTVLLRK